MEKKLTIKELAPYLPYVLKVSKIHTLHANNGIGNILQIIKAVNEGKSQYKPILRPLSHLTEEEEWKRKLLSFLSDGRSDMYDNPIIIHTKNKHSTFKIRMYTYMGLNSSELFEYTVYKDLNQTMTKYSLIEWALKNHFDVFGLIDRGLALPIDVKEVEGE